MKPKLPRELLWADKKSLDEFLVEPFNKKLFDLYIHLELGEKLIRIAPSKIFNEAYYQCTKAVFENNPSVDVDELELDIKANIGFKMASRTVLRLMYAIFVSRDNNTKEIEILKDQFDVFNFLIPDNKYYLDFIKQAQKKDGKQFIDLRPKPSPVEDLNLFSIYWPVVTRDFDREAIQVILDLWSDPKDKKNILELIEFAQEINKKANVKVHLNKENSDIQFLTSPLCKHYEKGPIHELNDIIIKNDVYIKDVITKVKNERINKLESNIKELISIIERLKSELNSQKRKKEQERSFTLGMILDYCENHSNNITGPSIIAMLNLFLRDAGNSTQEERQRVDEVEHKILHPDYGDNVQGNKTSFGDNSNMLNFNLPENANLKQILSSLPDDMKDSLINKLISKDNG